MGGDRGTSDRIWRGSSRLSCQRHEPEHGRGGLAELDAEGVLEPGRIRRPGGGRPSTTDAQPELEAALDALIEPVTRIWNIVTPTFERLLHGLQPVVLLQEDAMHGGPADPQALVPKLFCQLLLALRRPLQLRLGVSAQFFYINGAVGDFQREVNPAISGALHRRGRCGLDLQRRGGHPEASDVTYGLALSPAGAAVDPDSGVVSWTPSSDGLATFAVTAADVWAQRRRSRSTRRCAGRTGRQW